MNKKFIRLVMASSVGSLLWAGCATFERTSLTRDLNDRTISTNVVRITVPMMPFVKRTTYFKSPDFALFTSRETDAEALKAVAEGTVKGMKGGL